MSSEEVMSVLVFLGWCLKQCLDSAWLCLSVLALFWGAGASSHAGGTGAEAHAKSVGTSAKEIDGARVAVASAKGSHAKMFSVNFYGGFFPLALLSLLAPRVQCQLRGGTNSTTLSILCRWLSSLGQRWHALNAWVGVDSSVSALTCKSSTRKISIPSSDQDVVLLQTQ